MANPSPRATLAPSPAEAETVRMPPAPPGSSSADPSANDGPIQLRLYVAGDSPRSHNAILSLRRLDASPLSGRYQLEVIDVLQEPARAEEDHVLATPTLLRLSPGPRRRILGDLTDLDQLVLALSPPPPERARD
jgi:circadian clock protein KaiB